MGRPYCTITLSLLALAAASCTKPTPAAATAEAAPEATPYNTGIDVDEVMVHAMDPSARQFWAGWGETYDDKGWHDVSAKTDEEWKKVEDGAAMVVLATNTLMLPAYQRKPEAEWNKWARQVADIALRGKDAADKKDKAAMETIGGELDVACDKCHEAFRKVEK